MALTLVFVALACLWGVQVDAVTTLTATTTELCTSGDNNIPTGTGKTVVLNCVTTTNTIVQIAGSVATATAANGNVPAATIVFKQGGSAKFTLTGSAGSLTDGTGITTDDTTTYTAADVTSAVGGTPNTLAVTIANAPAALTTGGTWTCEVTAGGDTGNDGGAEDFAAEGAQTTPLDLAAFCSGKNTVALTATHTATDCRGTIVCDIGATVATVSGTSGVIQFLKGGTIQYQVLADGSFKAADGTTTVDDPVITTSGTAVTATYSGATQLDGAQDGTWACSVSSSTAAADNAISPTVAVQITDQTQCTTKSNLLKWDHCNKQLICELADAVATVQTNGGIVTFTKGATATYVVGTDDSLTTGTGATVAAPGSNTNQVVLTITTYDATTIDGSWKCGVASSSDTTENGDSATFTLAYSATGCSKGSQLTFNVFLVLVTVFAALLY